MDEREAMSMIDFKLKHYQTILDTEGYAPMEGKYYAVSVSKDKKAAYASGPGGSLAKLAFKE